MADLLGVETKQRRDGPRDMHETDWGVWPIIESETIMLTTTYSRSVAQPSQMALLTTALGLAKAALAAWRIRRASERLQGLDDRMLNDIGIDRADIDRAVRHGRSSFY